MDRVFTSFLFFFIGNIYATSIPEMSLPELVELADHVVIGTVCQVDIVDKENEEISDLQARTGPGLDNQIRLHIEIDEVIYTSTVVPEKLVIGLWSAWHNSLGGAKDAWEGKRQIFLLKSDSFKLVYPAYFRRNVEEQPRIEAILNELPNKRHQNAALRLDSQQVARVCGRRYTLGG